MDHSKQAHFIAEEVSQRQDLVGFARRKIEELAPVATMHAVLALLDRLDNSETEAEEVTRLYRRIAQLEEDLNGAYAALRARENADAAEMKERERELDQH